MKKILNVLSFAFVNLTFAVPVEIVANAPAQIQEMQSKMDVTTTLQTLINGISKAQTTASQIQALKNLQSLQNNPGAALSDINGAVSSLISNFNTLNNTGYSNLGDLISSLGASASTEAMNVKLMQASNMQLAGIQSTLTALQAQNQAIIAYKQNEANEEIQQQAVVKKMYQDQADSLNGL